MARRKALAVGDTVAFKADFVRNVIGLAGEFSRVKGTITALTPPGRPYTLATVKWDNPECPKKVNVKNLCRRGLNYGYCSG